MQRSLSKLREEGWFCEITEHFVPWPAPGHRKDLFGFSDIIAVRGPSAAGADDHGQQRGRACGEDYGTSSSRVLAYVTQPPNSRPCLAQGGEP